MTGYSLVYSLNYSEAALVTGERKRGSDEDGDPGNSADLWRDFPVTAV